MSEGDDLKMVDAQRAIEMAEIFELCASMLRAVAFTDGLAKSGLGVRSSNIIRQSIPCGEHVMPWHARMFMAQFEQPEHMLRLPSVGRKCMREIMEYARL